MFSRHTPISAGTWRTFSQALHYQPGQFDDPASYHQLRQRLDDIDRAHATQGNRLFYLATPPELFPVIIGQLGETGLNRPPMEHAFVRPPLVKLGAAEIGGELAANLQSAGTVLLRSTARLFGDVEAGNLVVEAGAVFVGAARVGKPS